MHGNKLINMKILQQIMENFLSIEAISKGLTKLTQESRSVIGFTEIYFSWMIYIINVNQSTFFSRCVHSFYVRLQWKTLYFELKGLHTRWYLPTRSVWQNIIKSRKYHNRFLLFKCCCYWKWAYFYRTLI